MRNVADVIEQFIIQELFAGEEDTVNVKRSQLAEKLSCAPSQITYTLTTRFTPDRGFEVESKRGNGGFIRIVRLPQPQMPTPNALPPVKKIETGEELVEILQQNRMITPREASVLRYFLAILGDHVATGEKLQLIKGAYRTMLEENRRG